MPLTARPAQSDAVQLVALALSEAAELQHAYDESDNPDEVFCGSAASAAAARRLSVDLAKARLEGGLVVLRAILDLDCAPASDLVRQIADGYDPEVLGAL